MGAIWSSSTWNSSQAIGLAAATLLGVLGLCGCSSSPTSPHASSGVLTGTAQACAGPVSVPIATLRVYRGDANTANRDVYRPSKPLVTERVPTNSTYRFVLAPGRYFITNSSPQFAHPFVLLAGATQHIDVPNWCM